MLFHCHSNNLIMFNLHPQLSKDTITIWDMPLCRTLLANDSQYPWVILVPRRNNIKESYQLEQTDRHQLQIESDTLSQLLMKHFDGDKLNVAALGNMVPQLHIHHIVRFKTDPAWPKPVWGERPAKPYTDLEKQSLTQEIGELIRSNPILSSC